LLTFSRTFGDIEAKIKELGGLEGVIVADPEITILEVPENLDYIVIGSDGIFDKMNNDEIVRAGWTGLSSTDDPMTCYKQACDTIMTQSLLKKTQDNISAVVVAFRN